MQIREKVTLSRDPDYREMLNFMDPSRAFASIIKNDNRTTYQVPAEWIPVIVVAIYVLDVYW
jgi:hypothetical protein